jgi:HAMP domain-containing protein
MLRWLTSGLLLRILVALLIVSVGPIFIIRAFTQQSYQDTRGEVVTQSQKALDEKALQGLESRSIALAKNVADFLTERENDLRFLASQPPNAQTYLNFGSAQNGKLWTVTSEGTETHFTMPIYREIVFVDLNGQEQIKVSDQCKEYPFQCSMAEDSSLTDVSRPINTLYRSETYFKDGVSLKPGEIYVGKPIGFHLPPEIAYASAQYRSGERYRGVLRMTAPVYQDGQRIGTLVIAVEMLHLIEFTAHIAPSNPAPQAEIDAREADFSYMVSPEGWAISQPRHFNIYGVDANGQPVKGINEADQAKEDNMYRPGNLTQMGFIDPAFPELVQHNQEGENGRLLTKQRALIYATIPYFSGQYNTPAGFGLVVLSTDGGRLHIDAEVLSKQFDNQIQSLSQFSIQLITATLLVVLILAVLLARTIVSPILRLTNTARLIEAGHWDKVNTAEIEKSGGGAEVGQLARVFASMANQIHARETELRKQVEGLKIVIDETKRKKAVEEITENEFFQDLSKRATEMRQRRSASESTDPEQK